MTFFRKKSKSTYCCMRILNNTPAPIYHTSSAIPIPNICPHKNINFTSLADHTDEIINNDSFNASYISKDSVHNNMKQTSIPTQYLLQTLLLNKCENKKWESRWNILFAYLPKNGQVKLSIIVITFV